ncbi:hypothetical protein [Bosea thiooxidans]
MRRLALTCLLAAATLLPVQAEAAKLRFGGRSSASTATKTSRSVIIMPGIGGAGRAQATEAEKPARVPFPPPSIRPEEPQLRLTSSEISPPKPWCRSNTVVGGFCLMN